MGKKSNEIVIMGIDLLFNIKEKIDTESFNELIDTLSLLGWEDLPEIKRLLSIYSSNYENILTLSKEDKKMKVALQQMSQSFDLLEDIKEAVDDNSYYLKMIINSLQFEDLDSTHSEIMNELDNTLKKMPEVYALKISLILIERAIINDMAFGQKDLDEALNILKDEKLYLQVLNQLYRQNLDNLSWENTFESVMLIVYSNKPQVAEIFEMFLWYTHALHTYKDPSMWYATYCEYMFNTNDILQNNSDEISLTSQLANLSLGTINSSNN